MAIIAERESDSRITELHEAGVKLYSFSKLNTIEKCPYCAWRTYVKKDRGIHNIYDIAGSKIHDVLESIMKNNASISDLKTALQSELKDMDMIGVDFPRDPRGGTSIRDKWIANMEHFCDNFKPPKGEFLTEELMIYKLNDKRAMIGYADLIRKNKDGSIDIFDWKTSSNFHQKDLLHHGRQFVIYKMACEQAGFKVRNTAWIMLKYVQIVYFGKRRKNAKSEEVITKICDRCKIGQTISPAVESKLEAAGYSEADIECFIFDLENTNSLSKLPPEIRSQFKIVPYVRPYTVTKELEAECIDFINRVADSFEAKLAECNEKGTIDVPWEPIEINKSNEFMCFNLCGHRQVCPGLKRYKELSDLMSASEEELF